MRRLLLALVVLLVALFAPADAWARVDAPSFAPADSRQGSDVQIVLSDGSPTLGPIEIVRSEPPVPPEVLGAETHAVGGAFGRGSGSHWLTAPRT